ncbi:MAG: hypothetical protein KAS23_06215 [Anaerohalosphaera sp.]|nr:hypothetical protein [Anaerohalosphaera sp.]
MNNIFEALMLVCFGAAWPASIYRSWVSRTAAGKSIVFLAVVELGYLAGITHKFINGIDGVIYLYVLNAVMVLVDICLYFRNKRIDIRTKVQ